MTLTTKCFFNMIMTGKPISIDGIVIPFNSPIFLMLIGIHVSAALVCVIAGIVAMLSKKQPGSHPKAGTVYFWGLLVVFATVIIISILRWTEDKHLLLLGFLSFSAAYLGRQAEIRRWHRWVIYHIILMGSSYIILLTAFYVDNGKFLPVWKNFSPIVYWTLPAIIGIPIILYTLIYHPLAKTK